MKTIKELSTEIYAGLCHIPVIGASNQRKICDLIENHVQDWAEDYCNSNKNAPLEGLQPEPDPKPPEDY